MAHAGGRPLKFATKELLQEKIDAYFRSCFDYKRDMFGGRMKDKELIGEKEGKDGKILSQWKANEYILEQVKPFTVSGLASFLDTSRETLMDYQEKDEFSDTIKRAKEQIYAYTEESLFTKASTGAIFSLKNNYGWKDKSEVDTTLKGELSVNNMKGASDEELLGILK